MRTRYQGWLILLLLQLAVLCHAGYDFPKLTGRVVDNASLLSPAVKEQLTQQLAAHEQQTTNQVVVLTLQTLQDYPIEDYGYQLGRHWGIGQKDKNNGILLIVAPNERKVRIEVGYGLEGQLTDALSHDIIQNRILPRFREGNFEAGIVAGVDSILAVLGGNYEPVKRLNSPKAKDSMNMLIIGLIALVVGGNILLGSIIKSKSTVSGIISLLAFVFSWLVIGSLVAAIFIAFLILLFTIFNGPGPRGGGRGGRGYSSGYGYGGYSGGGFSGGGGGFSGGGGSFGGGGASGGW